MVAPKGAAKEQVPVAAGGLGFDVVWVTSFDFADECCEWGSGCACGLECCGLLFYFGFDDGCLEAFVGGLCGSDLVFDAFGLYVVAVGAE